MVIFASGDLSLVVGLSPGAETDRVRSELVKRLPLELWASPAEMDAEALAAGDAYGANAVQGRHVVGGFETVAVRAEGRQQSWGRVQAQLLANCQRGSDRDESRRVQRSAFRTQL